VEIPLYRYRRHENNLTNDQKKVDYYNGKVQQKFA